MANSGPKLGPFRNEAVRLADLTVNTSVLEGVEFSNCQILGPAILLPLGSTSIVNCQWPGTIDALFWEIIPDRNHVIGAVGVLDCSFAS